MEDTYVDEIRKVNTNDSVKTVTSNSFISAKGLETLSLKARKMLYVAISQCKMTDESFYTYEISVKEFANLMNITPEAIYSEADKITTELMRGILQVTPKGEKRFRKYALFSMCEYQHGILRFKLNPDMTDFLLKLKGDFSKPLLSDFLQMQSPYSIAIWHLMQREMHSIKPGIEKIEFDLTLEELREITGTQNKLIKLSQFKDRCFDKAIKEIYSVCGIKITYTYIKKSRTVIGFHCVAKSDYYFDQDLIPQSVKDEIELKALKLESRRRVLSLEEQSKLKEAEMTLKF